jgi:flagellar hook-length control protein FliK
MGAASANQPHPSAQQAAAWLQQISAAGQTGATSTPPPAGTSSGAATGTQASQSASTWLQQIQASNVQVTSTSPAQTPAAIPTTILAANSAQSVAAMFSVPSFPAAMAFTAPAGSKAQALPGSTNSAAQTNAAQTAAQSTASSQEPAPGAVPASQAAQAENAKAATLAQAAQNSVRTGHAAPVTESQSLPLNFDASQAAVSSKADDARSGATDDAKDAQTADDHPTIAEPVQPSSVQTQALHATPASQPAAAPQPPAATTSALSSTTDAQAFAAQSQSGSAPSTAPSTAPGPSTPTASIGTPDLSALAVNIAAKSLEGARQFDIRLDPVELGRVDVRLSLDGSGTAQAHLSAERPETLSLLQNNAPALTRALQDSGVNVANNGLQFSLKGQDRQGDAQGRTASRSRSSAAQSISAAASLSGASATYGLSPSGSGVNILV